MSEAPKNKKTDKVRQVELLISNLLRVGVIVSLLVVVGGTAISFLRHRDYFDSHTDLAAITRMDADFPHSIKSVTDELMHGRGRAIVMCGLLLLIATPVARVVVSIFAFVYEEDRVFVIITSVVLLLLILSFFLGKAG